MTVADIIIKILEEEGIHTVFGCPGGAILPLYEALRLNDNVTHHLVRNEQAAAHAASGYAREKKKAGVCISTSGPGATNMLTGIATAYSDSIPLIAITGQVKTHLIGKDVFQEADVVGSTEPFTKYNFLVLDPDEICEVMSKAIKIATTGRPGPVLIDVPRDVLEAKAKFDYPRDIQLPGYNPTIKGHVGQIKRALRKLEAAERPVIFAGGGVQLADAKDELVSFAETAGIPVLNTMMGIGSFPMDSDCYAGIVGYHGDKHCDEVLKRSDLIVIVGARVSDRATKNFQTISETEIIHIDVDPAEIGKIVDSKVPIVGDAKAILRDLNKRIKKLDTNGWMDEVKSICSEDLEMDLSTSDTVNPKIALRLLSNMVDDKAIVTADVGQNQIWAARNFVYSGKRKYLTSGGLGTMGYSLSAAIGAKLANRDKTVISVSGDGGIQMLLGELGTLAETKEQVLVLIFNNNMLGMVRELQDGSYNSKYHGVHYNIEPDFVTIGKGYGIPGEHVNSNCQLEAAFERALSSEQSYIINFTVDPTFGSV